MDRSDRSIPLHAQVAPQQLLGGPLTLVVVSVLSIANAGVFAASVVWPLRHRTDVAPTTAVQKSNAMTLSRRLKGDRLAEPNITGEWLEQPGTRQDKDRALPQVPEPQILFPSAPSLPRDDDDACEPLVNARSGTPGSSAELCTAAIEAYRKVAAVPHRGNPAGIIVRNAQWRGTYA